MIACVKRSGEIGDLSTEDRSIHLILREVRFNVSQLALQFTQLAFQSKWPLLALLSPCNRHVVERFTSWRYEKGLRILRRESSRRLRISGNKAIAQLG